MAASERERLLRLPLDKLLAECEVDRYRASGPGGQKRNKTESAIRLRHASGVSSHAAESRSQHTNKRRALRRLRYKLALDLREVARDEDAVILAQRMDERVHKKGRQGADYLLRVATLLDRLLICGWAMASAARSIGTTTAALSRFIARDKRLERKVNEERSACGMRPLRG